jgi:Reverse transcriptase (RNA-dependent DNA polymerase)
MIVIPSRWVLCTKISPTTTKKKARFVIKGCSQVPGRDFDTTYAQTLSRETLRLVLVMKLERNMKIKQVDVRAAFVYRKLPFKVFTELPTHIYNEEETRNNVAEVRRAILDSDNPKCYGTLNSIKESTKKVSVVQISMHAYTTK